MLHWFSDTGCHVSVKLTIEHRAIVLATDIPLLSILKPEASKYTDWKPTTLDVGGHNPMRKNKVVQTLFAPNSQLL